ncbi:MAG: hypothetical protein GC154_17730 [bacterium]|nr:hypothetical protein [bacterium]
MSDRCIWGKILRILDEQRIIVSAGFEQGVGPGDHFHIIQIGEEINDPESGEALGQLHTIKAEVAAVHVQDKISLMMPLSEQQIRPDTVLSAVLAQTSSTSRTPLEPNRGRLYVRPTQVHGRGPIDPIEVGDTVRSVFAKK